MDELYSSLPLEKVEALEDLVNIGPPGLVKVNYLSYDTSSGYILACTVLSWKRHT